MLQLSKTHQVQAAASGMASLQLSWPGLGQGNELSHIAHAERRVDDQHDRNICDLADREELGQWIVRNLAPEGRLSRHDVARKHRGAAVGR